MLEGVTSLVVDAEGRIKSIRSLLERNCAKGVNHVSWFVPGLSKTFLEENLELIRNKGMELYLPDREGKCLYISLSPLKSLLGNSGFIYIIIGMDKYVSDVFSRQHSFTMGMGFWRWDMNIGVWDISHWLEFKLTEGLEGTRMNLIDVLKRYISPEDLFGFQSLIKSTLSSGESKEMEMQITNMPHVSFSVRINRMAERLLGGYIKLVGFPNNVAKRKQEELGDNPPEKTETSRNIVTTDKKFLHVINEATTVAQTDITVLITGESGTGKELIAELIHELSDRAGKPMIKVNCAAIPGNLFESELFGHERGAFSGAYRKKIGKFELANGGTLLLDEIGELPLELQPKLLRALQEGEFNRLGGERTRTADVRIVAATNRDLEEMVLQRKFREDLYFRLNVYPIHNIPLREKKGDIPLLVQYFINRLNRKIGRNVKRVSAQMMEDLLAYDYPGNVRELENIVERAMVISKTDVLKTDKRLMPQKVSVPNQEKWMTFEQMERWHILGALQVCNCRISGPKGAAELLGLNPKTLESKMRRLGIERHDALKFDFDPT